jgi:hypothetical protein
MYPIEEHPMSDQPENLMLVCLRRLDTKMDRLIEDTGDLRRRMTTVEVQVGNQTATENSHYAGVMLRLDRVEDRLDRIERRLDLTEPAGVAER